MIRAAILACLAALPSAAIAGEIALELGQCQFGLEREGTFYTSSRYTSNYMTPRCLELSYAFAFKRWPDTGLQIGFVNTQRIEVRDNVAPIAVEGVPPSMPCEPSSGFGCVGRFEGSGKTWGFNPSIYHDMRYQGLKFRARAGLFFFRHHFHATVEHIDCSSCGQYGEYDESTSLFSQPSPYAGLAVYYGNVYLSYKHYFKAEHRPLSVWNYEMDQWTAGVVLKKW